MKTIAILGPTASGKTALSIELALKYNAHIVSLDSLSIYKEIDIASAKPTLEERQGIKHFGMDVLLPSEHFDVTMFFELFNEAKHEALREGKNLIIVGGTGFYLKAMMEGLSIKPEISLYVKEKIDHLLLNLETSYALINAHDEAFASKIASSDRYRIEKWLEIFLTTGEIPSAYLLHAKQAPLIKEVALFEIDTPREILAQRIALRTQNMLTQGLVDEVFGLEKRYSRAPQCMKAIGIKEVLDYFDGKLTFNALSERISFNTIHLAKRQRTFNASQFPPHPKGDVNDLFGAIETHFKS
ncbi:tRNA (adenosine(37)-N6)-dimethylallyltransferase MiaA [Sulfurospirillum multivorans]|uniref:tRNA dimethylallyltransferase n=2 Tax=Sulfurospirillum multivorans TaxID=66821 RepID=A0AA86AIU3_SULMK|nr:tRNA (adenosine(37)-N6)-dimethylallyltransferase MiaA [Sulfurospirillum multivorans]AHJ11496.1 tRNA delta(2)-isopentenylpyrophosphate transferase [Sulfurospirillum multivorans DSM 12446]QEH04997.1 tRNA delta(2)-isopentenylpyrophosphate transferase [Sulfurospirillum multivorans]